MFPFSEGVFNRPIQIWFVTVTVTRKTVVNWIEEFHHIIDKRERIIQNYLPRSTLKIMVEII